MNGVVLPLRCGESLREELVEFLDEALLRAEEGNQVRDIVMHVPDVGPRIILVVVWARTRAAREDVVEGLDELARGILRMEEARLAVEQMAVVEAALEVELIILRATQLLGQLRDAPIIVGRRQSNGYRLTILERIDLRNALLLALVKCGEPAVGVIEVVERGLGATIPGNHTLGENRMVHTLEGSGHIELNALSQRIGKDCCGVVAVHTVGIAEDRGEGRHPSRLAIHTDVGVEFLAFGLRVENGLQGVQRVVGIPRPVVGPEGRTLVGVYIAIPRAVIVAILRDIDHSLVAAVKCRIEGHALILRASLDTNLAQSVVPRRAGIERNTLDIEI